MRNAEKIRCGEKKNHYFSPNNKFYKEFNPFCTLDKEGKWGRWLKMLKNCQKCGIIKYGKTIKN